MAKITIEIGKFTSSLEGDNSKVLNVLENFLLDELDNEELLELSNQEKLDKVLELWWNDLNGNYRSKLRGEKYRQMHDQIEAELDDEVPEVTKVSL